MSKLLTNRLSVVGKNRLKQTFSSCLAFTIKGISALPEDRCTLLLSAAEEFYEKSDIYIRFREFSMQPENINIWLNCLADGLYSFTLLETLKEKMSPVIKKPDASLDELWNIYTDVYAHQLLDYGSRVICNPENLFNQATVRHFIRHPEQTHGAELINDIPPLLENEYIYLNGCGEEQHTTWHRDTFLDSFFKALASYQAELSPKKIAQAFNISLNQDVEA